MALINSLIYWCLVLLALMLALRPFSHYPWLFFPLMMLVIVVHWWRKLRRQRLKIARRERIRQGLCPTCHYDLRASSGRCPECGNPIPHGDANTKHVWQMCIAAREILDWYRALCENPPRFIPTTATRAAGDDSAILDAYDRELAELGFHRLGDVESSLPSASAPKLLVVFCVYLDPGGIVTALVTRLDGNAPYVELTTEMSDGTFVQTSAISPAPNVSGVPSVPGIDHKRLWGKPEIATLLPLHCERLENAMSDSAPMPYPLPFCTLDELCGSLNRVMDLQAAHHKRIGYVDRDTLTSLCHGGLIPNEVELLVEIERQKSSAMLLPS